MLPGSNTLRRRTVAALSRVTGAAYDQERTGVSDDQLYSGRAVELDGVADYVNIGNRGTLAKAVSKITYQALRGAANATPRFRLNSSTDLVGPTLRRPGVWENHEITLTTPTASLTEVWLGRSGVGYSQCQLADVRFISADGEVLARYQLNEHPAGLVNTLPALDSSGNGYHGSYVGGTSVAGIGVPADFRGLSEYGDYMWFTGVSWVNFMPPISNTSEGYDITFTALRRDSTGEYRFANFSFQAAHSFRSFSATDIRIYIGGVTVGVNVAVFTIPSFFNIFRKFRVIYDGVNTVTLYVDDVFISQVVLSAPGSVTTNTFSFGAGAGGTFIGVLHSLNFNNALIATGNGTTSAAWGGGTVSGNPATIAEYRRTPPQIGVTGAWNTLPYYDSSASGNTGVASTTVVSVLDFSADFYIPNVFTAAAYVCGSSGGQILIGFNASGAFFNFPGVGSASIATTNYVGLHRLRWVWTRISSCQFYVDGVLRGSGGALNSFTPSGTWVLGQSRVGFMWNYSLTVNGGAVSTAAVVAPRQVVLSAAPSGLDALGNPIAVPRPTPTAFHSPNTSLFLRVDQTQVRALSFWFYHSGQAKTLWSGTGQPTISVAANGTVSTTSGTLRIPETVEAGTWNYVGVDFASAVNLTDYRTSTSFVSEFCAYQTELGASIHNRHWRARRIRYRGAALPAPVPGNLMLDGLDVAQEAPFYLYTGMEPDTVLTTTVDAEGP